MARDPSRRAFLSVDFKKLCLEFKQPYYGFHSFRRGHATDRSKTETLEAIAKDLGHSSTKTTEAYVL
jgi:integrase